MRTDGKRMLYTTNPSTPLYPLLLMAEPVPSYPGSQVRRNSKERFENTAFSVSRRINSPTAPLTSTIKMSQHRPQGSQSGIHTNRDRASGSRPKEVKK